MLIPQNYFFNTFYFNLSLKPSKGIRPDETVNHELHKDQVAKNTDKTNVAPDGARLNLIIQYPIFNRTIDDGWAVQRQKEVTYCLQQNLLSPHVSKKLAMCFLPSLSVMC